MTLKPEYVYAELKGGPLNGVPIQVLLTNHQPPRRLDIDVPVVLSWAGEVDPIFINKQRHIYYLKRLVVNDSIDIIYEHHPDPKKLPPLYPN